MQSNQKQRKGMAEAREDLPCSGDSDPKIDAAMQLLNKPRQEQQIGELNKRGDKLMDTQALSTLLASICDRKYNM